MTNKYDWLLRKTPRSVDAMRLWKENPRLDPEGEYYHLSDFTEEMISSEPDRKDFVDLAKSIADKGFIPADPVVLWQNEENNKYYVAEGNRRVLALKLLRNPHSAPKIIRSIFVKLSKEVDITNFDKIPVSIAPTFEDAEWYISQRNSMTSLQRRWTAEQQRRWVAELYEKYEGDILKIKDRIDLSEYDLQRNIRILKLKSWVHDVKDILTKEEFDKAKSFRFPITTFERFFFSSKVREAWGLEFEGYDVKLSTDRDSFLKAFAIVVKRMILPENDPDKIDSRSVGTIEDIVKTIETLPVVEAGIFDPNASNSTNEDETSVPEEPEKEEPEAEPESSASPAKPNKQKDNPNRNRLIDNSYELISDQFRLVDIFEEMKKIPFSYSNSIAASIRIFLDLSVLNYIKQENLEADIKKECKGVLRNITLKQKLEFIRKRSSGTQIENILSKFLNPENQYSLDVLNGYQHAGDHHFINKEFLNRFWDFLLPLFRTLVEIKDTDEQ